MFQETVLMGARGWATSGFLVWMLATLALSFGACSYPFELREGENRCSDGMDNDGDGATDCDDADCQGSTGCLGEGECGDGVDNDGDGATDCDDSDCSDASVCASEVECHDGQDDDGDGQVDCDDEDCVDDPFCVGPYPCNGNGECEGFEDRVWCDDCCPDCALTEGSTFDYIALTVTIPSDEPETQDIGVDLDGDGDVDNKLGKLVNAFYAYSPADINDKIAEGVEQGHYIMLFRLLVSGWPDDESVAFQLFEGDATEDATEDNLTGDGHTLISGQSDRSLYLCGDLTESHLDTCTGPIDLPIYLPRRILTIPMDIARAHSTTFVTPDGWGSLMVGGGMNELTVRNQLIPYLRQFLNEQTVRDPESTVGEFVLMLLDNECSQGMTGCQHVVNGEGDCVAWDGDPQNPPLSLDELLCNAFFMSQLSPDVDWDGDGEPELLSAGLKTSVVPITIDN